MVKLMETECLVDGHTIEKRLDMGISEGRFFYGCDRCCTPLEYHIINGTLEGQVAKDVAFIAVLITKS